MPASGTAPVIIIDTRTNASTTFLCTTFTCITTANTANLAWFIVQVGTTTPDAIGRRRVIADVAAPIIGITTASITT